MPHSQKWTDRTACIRRLVSDFRSQKESDFLEWLQSHAHYGDTAISKATINATMRYGNSAHLGDAANSNFAFKIAVKPLQIE